MHATTMQSISAVGALPAPEKRKEPSPEWHIVQKVLSQSMNTLDNSVSLALILDGLTSSLLEICLAIALTCPWNSSTGQWPLIHLIEAGRWNLLEPYSAEWYFYEYGNAKAIVALYLATIDDKQFFNYFDNLEYHSKLSLIRRIPGKVCALY
jgi:hypothetical protein